MKPLARFAAIVRSKAQPRGFFGMLVMVGLGAVLLFETALTPWSGFVFTPSVFALGVDVVGAVVAALLALSVVAAWPSEKPLSTGLPSPRHLLWAALATTLVNALAFERWQQPQNESLSFALTFSAELVLTFVVGRVLFQVLRLSTNWVERLQWFVPLPVAAFGLAGLVAQSWWPLSRCTNELSIIREASLAIMPLLGLGISLRTHKVGWKTLKLHLNLLRHDTSTREALALFFSGNALLLCGAVISTIFLGTITGLSVSLAWLGVLRLSTVTWKTLAAEREQALAALNITSTPAKRFMLRHRNERPIWAAAVGLRTAHFLIDHDPELELQEKLPATLLQIRGEEIQRCLSELLPGYLHNYVTGHRIQGATDPEVSLRPCVDMLKLFSCLYLDAGPLIERRLNILATLLPIVDPGLARLIKTDDISRLIKRNQWFFYCDYGWVDQHAVHSNRLTRYGVRIGNVSSAERQAIMDYLKRTNGRGSLIWIGPDARDRLLLEAPVLANIIEPCPISQPEGDLLLFVIKFESLIPRLQAYYGLDQMRSVILDFDPSAESARLLGILEMQLQSARSESEQLAVVDTLVSLPWRGFREKDAALQLVLRAFHRLQPSEVTKGRFLEAIAQIGYPSQILHQAQLDKLALRSGSTLVEVAQNPDHARFSEAWLLLACADFRRYESHERRQLLAFLAKVPQHSALRALSLVQTKSIEALGNVAGCLDPSAVPLVGETLNAYALWLVRAEASPDLCCLFLDVRLYLEEALRQPVPLSPAVFAAFANHVASILDRLGTADPLAVGLNARWQRLAAKAMTHQAARAG